MQIPMLRSAFAVAVFAICFAHPVAAADVELNDLLGRWCGEASNYVFSHTQLAVELHSGGRPKHGPVLKISSATGKGAHITIEWKPVKPGNSTGFELSENRRELVQVPQTKGDKGPRRVFHRC